MTIADATDNDDAPWTNQWLRRFAIDADHAPLRGSLGLPIPRSLWSGVIALVLSLGAIPLFGLLALDGWLRWAIVVACALLIGALALVAGRALGPHILTVGSDGVLVDAGLARTFIAHSNIERVEFVGAGRLGIRVRGGRVVKADGLFDARQRDGLHAAIEAWFRRGAPLADTLQVLGRGEDPTKRWLERGEPVLRKIQWARFAEGYQRWSPAPP